MAPRMRAAARRLWLPALLVAGLVLFLGLGGHHNLG